VRHCSRSKSQRAAGAQTSGLFLTALGTEADVLRGFGVGADDYVVKPFSPRELLVRVDAILRRSALQARPLSDAVGVGPLSLNDAALTCTVGHTPVELTPHEFRILRQLVASPNRVFSRTVLIASLYGTEHAVSPKAIDVHVHHLRAKLGGEVGAMIQTVRGFGYKLTPRPPWLTLQIIAANVAVILSLAVAWYWAFMQQSSVYSERLMSTFNIQPGQLHAMYVDDVEQQLWNSVMVGLVAATLASIGLAWLIVRLGQPR